MCVTVPKVVQGGPKSKDCGGSLTSAIVPNMNVLGEAPFMALRGNVRTPSMDRWKARGRLYIRRN